MLFFPETFNAPPAPDPLSSVRDLERKHVIAFFAGYRGRCGAEVENSAEYAFIDFRYEGSPNFPKFDWRLCVANTRFLGGDLFGLLEGLLQEGTELLDMVTRWSCDDYLPQIMINGGILIIQPYIRVRLLEYMNARKVKLKYWEKGMGICP